MMSVRQVPWHGIGTVVQEAPTAEEAIHLAGLDWEVEQKPIYCEGMLAPGALGNVRTRINPDTGETEKSILGIVTESYKPIQNSEAFDFFDSLIGKEAHYETAGSLGEGRRIFLTALMEQDWKVADDKIETYLLLTNGHDGRHALRAAITPIRVVCQNTLNAALRDCQRSWAIPHVTGIKEKAREAREALGLTAAYMNAFVEFGNRAADKKVSNKMMSNLMKELFAPLRQTDQGKKNFEKRVSVFEQCLQRPDIKPYAGTLWGVLNAVSDYETHTNRRVAVMTKVVNDRLPLWNKAFRMLNAG